MRLTTLVIGLAASLLVGCTEFKATESPTDSKVDVVGDYPVTINLDEDSKYHISVADATKDSKGLIQVGNGLDINEGLLSVHFGTDGSSVAVGNDPRFGESLKIQGVPVSPQSPDLNQVLSFDGTNWTPKSIVATGTIATQNADDVSITGGSISNVNIDLSGLKTGLNLPKGSSADRDSNPLGSSLRLNETTHQLEFYDQDEWKSLYSSSDLIPNVFSLNGQSGASQTMTVGSAGTTPSIESSLNSHVINIPEASASGVTAGLLSNTDYLLFKSKQDALGFTPLNKAGDQMSGDLDMGSHKMTNVLDPSDDQDAVTKAYADSNFAGKHIDLTGLSTGQTVTWDSSQNTWVPYSPNGGTLTGVTGIAPVSVTSGSPIPEISLTNGTADGQTLRWNGALWAVAKLKYSDLLNSVSLNPWPLNSCSNGQAITWSSISDSFSCTTLLIGTEQLTGVLQSAQLPAFSGDVTSVVGSPVLTLSNSGVTAGTYNQVTVDSKGRVTAGSNNQTLSGYGITDAVKNEGFAVSLQAGPDSAKPAAGTIGRIYLATDSQRIYEDLGASWSLVADHTGGTVTSISSGNGLTGGTITESGTIGLATVGVAGTYTKVTTDEYGRVTSGGSLSSADIPTLDASKITGTLGISQIPPLDANKIVSGIFDSARIPNINASKIDGQIEASQINAPICNANQSLTKTETGFSCVDQAAAPPSLPPSGVASGDLGGSYPNPYVKSIQGIPVSQTTPTLNQVLTYDGTTWAATSPLALLSKVSFTTSGSSLTASPSTVHDIYTSSAFTVNLPCGAAEGMMIGVRNSTTSSAVTVKLCTGETFESGNSLILNTNGASAVFMRTSSSTVRQWMIISAYGVGKTSCPSGMSIVGSPGGSDTYCVDTSSQTSVNVYNAQLACSDRGMKLCDYKDWYKACVRGASPSLVGMNDGNREWVDEAFIDTSHSLSTGGSYCESRFSSNADTGTKLGYRCCLRVN